MQARRWSVGCFIVALSVACTRAPIAATSSPPTSAHRPALTETPTPALPAPVRSGAAWTDLFIYPPFAFRAVDALLTNFHLPRSTLLMLVAAFAGYEPVMAAYREAVRERYRLYSYGDAMTVV